MDANGWRLGFTEQTIHTQNVTYPWVDDCFDVKCKIRSMCAHCTLLERKCSASSLYISSQCYSPILSALSMSSLFKLSSSPGSNLFSSPRRFICDSLDFFLKFLDKVNHLFLIYSLAEECYEKRIASSAKYSRCSSTFLQRNYRTVMCLELLEIQFFFPTRLEGSKALESRITTVSIEVHMWWSVEIFNNFPGNVPSLKLTVQIIAKTIHAMQILALSNVFVESFALIRCCDLSHMKAIHFNMN